MMLADYAAGLGLPVFPCAATKQPITLGGFYDASRNPETIRAMFSAPAAAMIGMPTGRTSGLVAIDVDIKRGAPGMEWLEANSHRLPSTQTHRTASGGLHLLFRCPAIALRNSAGRVAAGVDVRAEGGYIIWPGSPGYSVADDSEPAEMPQWLIDACLPPPAPPRDQFSPTFSPTAAQVPDRYAATALRGECEDVASAPEGRRNHQLNTSAFKLGTLVGAGLLQRSTAEAELTAAAIAAGLDRREITLTIKSGIEAGMQKPREVAVRPFDDQPMPGSVGSAAPDREGRADDGAGHPPDAAPPLPLIATPFAPAELLTLEPRRWVYGHFLIRRFLSVLGAPGGTGKTAYAIAVGLSVAMDKALVGEKVHEAGPVWLYNLEDPRDEMLRRVYAACIHHKIEPAELASRLYLDSGRDKPLVIAEKTTDGGTVAMPIVDELVDELKRRGVRLLVVDPFVKSHRLEENRNEHVDFAATLWNKVADRADCAILLLHHFRKGGQSGDVDAFRGAVALTDASRAAVSLAVMSEKEAGTFGVEPSRRRFYVRADNAKLNLAPPPEETLWLEMQSVDLPNGDKVQSVGHWAPPSPWEGLSAQAVVNILHALRQAPMTGEMWTDNTRSKTRWAGNVIVENSELTAEQAAIVLRAWIKNGLLKPVQYTNRKREEATGLEVNHDEFSKLIQQEGLPE